MVKTSYSGIDPDARIYHFIRLPHFPRLVRGKLVFVCPTKWEDPYERLPSMCMVIDKRTSPWQKLPLRNWLSSAFVQCWSMNQDSDTYLRAYSSVRKNEQGQNSDTQNESVRIATTAGRLQAD